MTTTVLQIGWCDPNLSFGGVESVIAGLLKWLPHHGVGAVSAVLPSTNSEFLILGRSDKEIPFARFRADLKRVIADEGIQIVHSHNLHRPNGNGVAREVVEVCEELGIAHVMTVHDCGVPVNVEQQQEARWVLSRSTCVATSEFNAVQVARTYGTTVKAVIEPGMEFASTIPPERSGQLRTFCSPGRLSAAKGIMEAVVAVGHLSRVLGSLSLLLSNPRANQFGFHTGFCEQVARVAAAFPDLEIVYFNGAKSVPDIYEQAAATICIAKSVEGFGLTPLESIACGRPVAVYPTGGLEWTREFRCIATLQSNRQTELLTTLENLITKQTTWYEAIRTEYPKIIRRFSMEKAIARYAEIYTRVLKKAAS